MNSYTQEYNDAIRSADREMKGYIQFNGDATKKMRGEDGLISFTVTQQIMEQERFCIGGAVSCRCEASFFNSGVPSGVSLAASYFDAYVGVRVGGSDGDTYTGTVFESQSIFLDGGEPALLSGSDIASTPAGSTVTLTFGNYTASGTWSDGMTATSGNIEFTITKSGTAYYINALDTVGQAYLSGPFTVSATYGADAFQYQCLGRFYISEISRGKESSSVVAYDAVNHYLSEKYTPTVTKTANGYLAKDILNDIIDQTGVQGGEHFTSSIFNFYVPEIVEATCRETWGWLMVCAYNTSRPGVNCYGSLNVLGNIAMRGYNTGAVEYDNYPAITDDQIYMDGLTIGDDFTINSLTTGTEENPIVLGSGVGINSPNPYITTAQATSIFNALQGITYTPMTLHFRGDPAIGLYDSLKVTQGGTDHRCICMKITSTFNGGFEQTIECWGDSEAYYEMSYSPMESKIQTNNNLIKEIASSIETARGGVISQILDADGTWAELTIANNQDLSQATSVWRFNINGLAHSNRYSGGTYTFALDSQGRIVATLIQTGILQDSQGKNYWNLDTGDFKITEGSINITTSSSSQDAITLAYGTASATTYRYYNYLSPQGINISNMNSSSQTSCTYQGQNAKWDRYTNGALTSRGVASTDWFGLENGTNLSMLYPSYLALYTETGFNQVGTQIRSLFDTSGLAFYNSSGTQTALYPSGGLTYTAGTQLATSLTSATSTDLRSVSLPAGKYLLIGQASFASNATGNRRLTIGVSSATIASGIAWEWVPALSGASTRLNLTGYYEFSATTTVYLVAWQNSGSALNIESSALKCIKLP